MLYIPGYAPLQWRKPSRFHDGPVLLCFTVVCTEEWLTQVAHGHMVVYVVLTAHSFYKDICVVFFCCSMGIFDLCSSQQMLWFITIHLGTPYSHLFTIYPHLASLARHSVTMIRPQPRLKFYKKSATGLQFLKLCGLRSAHTHTDQEVRIVPHTF